MPNKIIGITYEAIGDGPMKFYVSSMKLGVCPMKL